MQLSTLENNSPDYSLKLCSVNIYNFSEAFTFPQSENQRLWIIISGNGAYYNTRDEQTRKYKKLPLYQRNVRLNGFLHPQIRKPLFFVPSTSFMPHRHLPTITQEKAIKGITVFSAMNLNVKQSR